MKHRRVVATVVVVGALLLVAGGCSDDDSKTSTSSSSTSSSSSSPSTSSSSSSGGSTSSAGAAALDVAMNTKVGQEILVDANGMTVYLYEPDGASTTTKVPAAILAVWPPVTAESATVGAGLDESKAKLQPQTDGSNQLSYNGHLLYTFASDAAPGDANGQALGNIWFVLSPDGNKIG